MNFDAISSRLAEKIEQKKQEMEDLKLEEKYEIKINQRSEDVDGELDTKLFYTQILSGISPEKAKLKEKLENKK